MTLMESLRILFLTGRDAQPCHGDAEECTGFAVGVVSSSRTAPFTFYNSHQKCIIPRFSSRSTLKQIHGDLSSLSSCSRLSGNFGLYYV